MKIKIEFEVEEDEIFKRDGFKTYLVKLDVIGIPHPIYIDVCANDENEAKDCAAELFAGKIYGDFDVEEAVELK